jgi:dipeptidyl aminopeptidase/acylaminoacyl peptidase
VVDYLTTLPYLDPDRIGGMGICAGGGYTANAAINDRRIKAVGTVSAVNIGSMFRKHVVEGSNHMQLYDVPKYVDEAVSVLAPFLQVESLARRSFSAGPRRRC